MADNGKRDGDLSKTLERLYRGEPDSIDVDQNTLTAIYNVLPKDAAPHWFCSKAEKLTQEAARFSMRMLAYDGPRAQDWKTLLFKCLSTCPNCAFTFREAKYSTRRTYFGAFPDHIMDAFYDQFAQWEMDSTIAFLEQALHSLTDGNSLFDVYPSLLFCILSDWKISVNLIIADIVRRHVPKQAIDSWPKEVPPVGLFLMLMEQNSEARTWALKQITICTVTPMQAEHFLPLYSEVLSLATRAVSAMSDPTGNMERVPYIQFTQDLRDLWAAYSIFLRYVPPESLTKDTVRAAVAHLSDTGNHFVEVLRAFLILLNRQGPTLWKGEGEDYALVVFATIKDNVTFAETLRTLNQEHGLWLVRWVEAYVKALDPSALHTVIPLIMQFLCEELQHERYDRIRATALSVAAKILSVVLASQAGGELPDIEIIWQTLDIHSDAFVTVAFGKSYLGEKWAEARASSRRLVEFAIKRDVGDIYDAVATITDPPSPTFSFTPRSVREQMWRKMYETILPDDSNALATVFEVISAMSHTDHLLEAAYVDIFKPLDNPKDAQKALRAVNHALDVFRDGYSNAISRHLDFSDSVAALDLLRQPGVVKSIMSIMFSPLDSLREPVQGFVGLAFDVDSRPDCLRALLMNFPNAAIEGMMHFLRLFSAYATLVPEACSVSKSLALCFTDVIDVLCSTPNGLLHQKGFLTSIDTPGPEVLLPKWWSLMAQALVVIFRRTPKWATYFENETMVIWMRDALIFGRDMLAQRKVVEGAALTFAPQPPAKRMISETGKRMVNDLQQVLQELTRWLRLTDEELLHQAFALLQSLLSCFKETGIQPNSFILEKLQKHINDARTSDHSTKLDSARLSRLQEAISSFTEPEVEVISPEDVADDEIQIISHTKRKKPVEQRPVRREPEKTSKATAPKIHAQRPTRPPEPVRKDRVGGFTKDDQIRLESAASISKFKLSKPQVPLAESSKAVANRATSSKATSAAPSESEESDDDGGPSLEDMARKPVVVKKPTERRRIMMLDLPTNARNPALERLNKKEEARRIALRLKPDISSLHKTILSWNYEHNGSEPPGSQLRFLSVPDQFSDVGHYRRVFEPLLLLECWAQIQQSKEEASESYESKIVSRQYTDDWIDLDISVSEMVQKDWYLSDTDIVLLKHPDGTKRYMAKVQFFKSSPMGLQATVRLRLSENDLGPQSNTTWLLSRVFSLTTLHREYAALMGLPYYDLCNTILSANLSKPASVDSQDIKQTMSSYSLNEPQARAILSALRTDGFSLIQGPPGTGKTSTICGLVQGYLARRVKPATVINVGRNAGPGDKEPPKKILLCAPSNAAIDEITFRLKEGVAGPGRRVTPPKVVRVGAPKGMNVSVKDVSLAQLVEQKLNDDPDAKSSAKDSGSEMALLRSELESVKRLRQAKLDEMATIRDNTAKTLALEDEVRKLNKQKTGLTHQLDKLRDKQKSDNRAMDAISRRFRAEVLFEADVICSTLSGAGHELLESFDFEMVVIDEAAQAIELSSLIPLKYRCNRCVMVGDPQQLPPTVISQEASKYGYNQSLFVRLQKHRPDAVHLLSIQYRMHPQISILPSRLFYDGRLVDGPDMGQKTVKPWHSNDKFGEYRFYNVSGAEQSGAFHSLVNHSEVQVAVALFNRLRQEYTNFDFDFKVGIVTMYRAQVTELRRAFERRFGSNITGVVDFNTVDGFQGQEKDIIILSCVRAGTNLQTVGFLADVRRMNVALTRAKSSVFVLGNAATLERSDTTWRQIVHDARDRSRLVDADVAYFTASRLAPSRPAVHNPKPKSTNKATDIPLPILATPRQLAANVRPPPSKSQSARPASINMASVSTVSTASTEAPHIGHKRRAEEPDLATPSEALQPRNTSEQQKTKPRLTKKQKKQAPSLFIPKKRPPPQGDDSGPSTNRRRV